MIFPLNAKKHEIKIFGLTFNSIIIISPKKNQIKSLNIM